MDTLDRFAELITERTGFEPTQTDGVWILRRGKVCRLLEIPRLPRRTEIRYFPTRDSLNIPLIEVLHYMQISLTDRQLGDLFWLEKMKIFGDQVFIAWRNVNYLWYLRRLNRVPRGLPVQVRILDELIRTVFEPRKLRGISEFDLSQCIDGGTFRPDYYISGLTRHLMIEIDEDHHDRGATSLKQTLVDREKALLGATDYFAVYTVRVRDWNNRYHRRKIIENLNDYLDRYHLNEFFDAFREFNRVSFDALTTAFGTEIMNRLCETNFGCVIPWDEALRALQVDSTTRKRLEQMVGGETSEHTLLHSSFDSDDGDSDDDDDSDDDSDDDDDSCGQKCDSPITFLEAGYHYENTEGCIRINLAGVMQLAAEARGTVARQIVDAAARLLQFTYTRLDKFAPVSRKPTEIKSSVSAFARIPLLRLERELGAKTDRLKCYEGEMNRWIEKYQLPEEPIGLDPFEAE